MTQVTFACRYCGKVVTYEYTRGRRRRYCSSRCQRVASYDDAQNSSVNIYGATSTARVTTECGSCGVAIVHYRSHPRKLCDSCLNSRLCDICGAAYRPNNGLQRWCMKCLPDKGSRARFRRYGILPAEWDALVTRFGGSCWICRESPATVVDHCHQTGRVRGALCRPCNKTLYYIEHPVWLVMAQEYLESHSDGWVDGDRSLCDAGCKT